MWFILILTLCCAALPQYDFINIYRISIGWVQVGVFEFGLALGLLFALIKGGDYAQRFPSQRTHPVLVWLLTLFSIATIFGLLGSIGTSMPIKYKVAAFREFVSLPICIIMGYRLLSIPKQATVYAYVSVLAGVIVALLVMIYFNSEAQKVELSGSISPLRSTVNQLTPEFANCAGLLLLWSISARQRLFRPSIAFAIAMFCFIGYLGMLGRTHVVVMLGGAIAILFIVPRERRFSSGLRLFVLGPIIFAGLYGSLVLGGIMVGRANFVEKITTHFATLLPSERR